ncbi:MAG: HAMP domain-containing histidine kinase [Chitinophagaceae bacterium]|nr:HAMP domain-containing histidine kinase [Chitinophagaceae bacterium]
MKPLLSKTTRPFIIYVLIVFAISIPVYYVVVDSIWSAELDAHNKIVAAKTAYELNRRNLSDEKLENSIEVWNSIQPGTNILELKPGDNQKDTTFTIYKNTPYYPPEKIDRFRVLSTIVQLNGKPYRFVSETNIEETKDTIIALTIVTIFFFILVVIGLLLLNRKLSYTIWKPFQNTLDKLRKFNLNSQTEIDFEKTNTKEFEELNESLKKLIAHNISAYKTQKEFTENASHELQTPLAILKNKLDILLQSDDLTERQYHIAEEMNKALIRSSRINKGLLLLAKIENNQFDNSENIRLDNLVNQRLEALQEHFKEKQIAISTNIHPDITLNGNGNLTETLINNLLVNAVLHTAPGGAIKVNVSESGFQISNTGKQVLDQHLLFKRFSKMSANSSGSGLGLSIVSEICKFHGWKVSYEFDGEYHQFTVLT